MGERFNYYRFLTNYKEEQGKKILTEDNTNENKLVTHRVIKEEPLQYKIVVNVESRPGVDYGYTVEAGSEDEALALLKDKIGEITYSVKSIKGFQISPDLPVEPAGTIDGKKVDMGTVQLDGVDDRDYPDFTDTFIATANFKDGTELTDDQLNRLQDQHADQLHQWAYESLFEGLTPKEKVLKEAVIKLIVSEGLEGYSNDALADMIVNLSRYEGNEQDIQDVKKELAKRKGSVKENTLEHPDDIEWTEDGVLPYGGTDNPWDQDESEREGYDVEMNGKSTSTGKYYVGIAAGSYGETDYDSIEIDREMRPEEAEAYQDYLDKQLQKR